MNLSFLDEIFKPIGSGLADVDKFVDREMPFDSGWGFPAALVAAYFAPQLIPSLIEGGGAAGVGAAEGAGAAAGAEGSIGSGGMNSLLSSLGLEGGGSFAGQEAFSLPSSAYTPDYLNALAQSQGVDAGDPSLFSRLMGNTEQGLYNREGLAQKLSAQTPADMLKNRAQMGALSQLSKSGVAMQQQGQQSPQMQVPQAMMRGGQPVDTTTALLYLLQDRQQSRQPRISLI